MYWKYWNTSNKCAYLSRKIIQNLYLKVEEAYYFTCMSKKKLKILVIWINIGISVCMPHKCRCGLSRVWKNIKKNKWSKKLSQKIFIIFVFVIKPETFYNLEVLKKSARYIFLRLGCIRHILQKMKFSTVYAYITFSLMKKYINICKVNL